MEGDKTVIEWITALAGPLLAATVAPSLIAKHKAEARKANAEASQIERK